MRKTAPKQFMLSRRFLSRVGIFIAAPVGPESNQADEHHGYGLDPPWDCVVFARHTSLLVVVRQDLVAVAPAFLFGSMVSKPTNKFATDGRRQEET
ncbi:hypothetical protein E5D57_007766 [Metarhizium anisopliae]|nr:hypothetical protein E5D57_007766 [Metarhizium anisopliae]